MIVVYGRDVTVGVQVGSANTSINKKRRKHTNSRRGRKKLMDDLIERQAAIDAVCMGILSAATLYGRTDEGMTAKKEILRAINDLPSAQPEPQWIPCSERLPGEYGEYRITWITSLSKKRLIGDAEFEITSVWDNEHYRFKGEWLIDDYIKNYPDVKVLAWKPIEEPWRGEE